MTTTIMLSPVPNKVFQVVSGVIYTADQFGIIDSVASVADQASLIALGCAPLAPAYQTNLLGYLDGANFNSTADQIITMVNNAVRFRVTKITALNTSANNMATAAGGIYTATSKSGSAIVASSQVYTGLTTAATALDLTIALPNLVQAAGSVLYLSLTTAHGSAATADLAVFGDVYP